MIDPTHHRIPDMPCDRWRLSRGMTGRRGPRVGRKRAAWSLSIVISDRYGINEAAPMVPCRISRGHWKGASTASKNCRISAVMFMPFEVGGPIQCLQCRLLSIAHGSYCCMVQGIGPMLVQIMDNLTMDNVNPQLKIDSCNKFVKLVTNGIDIEEYQPIENVIRKYGSPMTHRGYVLMVRHVGFEWHLGIRSRRCVLVHIGYCAILLRRCHIYMLPFGSTLTFSL